MKITVIRIINARALEKFQMAIPSSAVAVVAAAKNLENIFGSDGTLFIVTSSSAAGAEGRGTTSALTGSACIDGVLICSSFTGMPFFGGVMSGVLGLPSELIPYPEME
jgi:hypothetical protein